MSKSLTLFCSLLVVGFACKKSSTPDIPVCIQQQIDNAKINNLNSNNFQITEYLYQGKKVYAIFPHLADAGIRIYDDNCNSICLIGGFIRNATTLCNGEVFFDKAEKIRDLISP